MLRGGLELFADKKGLERDGLWTVFDLVTLELRRKGRLERPTNGRVRLRDRGRGERID